MVLPLMQVKILHQDGEGRGEISPLWQHEGGEGHRLEDERVGPRECYRESRQVEVGGDGKGRQREMGECGRRTLLCGLPKTSKVNIRAF